jgi:hypothetical protein
VGEGNLTPCPAARVMVVCEDVVISAARVEYPLLVATYAELITYVPFIFATNMLY